MASKAKISFSVADIPLGIALEEYFLLASHLKVDGLELVIGWKTRFWLKKIIRLSNRYSVPITSVHQPPWSVAGFIKDEKSFHFARQFGAKFVAHPPAVQHLNSDKSNIYYKWLKEMGKKYDLEILIENMTNIYQLLPLLHYVARKHHDSATELPRFEKICKKYGFGFTLDISHLMFTDPQNAPGFKELFPMMKNIHLSDFTEKKEHLGLGNGKLNYDGFLTFLKEKKYSGIVNLELCPRILNAREKYYKDITESVKIVKDYLG